MRVRKAEEVDIPALAKVAARSYRTGFQSILEDEILATRNAAFFARRFEGAWTRMWAAEADRRIVGFCMLTGCHIDMLFVDPGHAGKGVGSALLREAEAAGATSLECFRDNHSARRFYEAQGWVVAREYERDFIGRSRSFVRYERPAGVPAR